MKRLNTDQRDALKEIESMGAGKASQKLSEKMGEKVKLTVPDIHLAKKEELENLAGGSGKMVVGVHTPLMGDFSGNVFIAFQKKDALALVDILSDQEIGNTKVLNKKGKEEIRKLGETLIVPYLTPLTNFLKINVDYKEPSVISTFGKTLSEFLILDIQQEKQSLLLIKTQFCLPGRNIDGDFVLLLAFDSINKLINAIDQKF